MTSGLITNPLRPSGPDADVRLRLKPAAPTSGHVDGSWWPRSRDLAAELPDLLAVQWHPEWQVRDNPFYLGTFEAFAAACRARRARRAQTQEA